MIFIVDKQGTKADSIEVVGYRVKVVDLFLEGVKQFCNVKLLRVRQNHLSSENYGRLKTAVKRKTAGQTDLTLIAI